MAGKFKEVDKFDSQFFGQTAKYVEVMSPDMRMSMELVYEAIVDAGTEPIRTKREEKSYQTLIRREIKRFFEHFKLFKKVEVH